MYADARSNLMTSSHSRQVWLCWTVYCGSLPAHALRHRRRVHVERKLRRFENQPRQNVFKRVESDQGGQGLLVARSWLVHRTVTPTDIQMLTRGPLDGGATAPAIM